MKMTFKDPFFGASHASDLTPISFDAAKRVASRHNVNTAMLLAFANHESRLRSFTAVGPLINHRELEKIPLQKDRYVALLKAIATSKLTGANLDQFKKTAFGMGQIMGANWKLVASSPQDFLAQVYQSAESQLNMIAKFIRATAALKVAVATRDYDIIAKLYAGAAWKRVYPHFVKELVRMVDYYDGLLSGKGSKP